MPFLSSTHSSRHIHGLFVKCARIFWMVRQNGLRVSLNASPDSDSQDMQDKCTLSLLVEQIRCLVSTFQKILAYKSLNNHSFIKTIKNISESGCFLSWDCLLSIRIWMFSPSESGCSLPWESSTYWFSVFRFHFRFSSFPYILSATWR